MSDCSDSSVCEDETLLQNAACNEKDFRWHVLKALCYITEYLSQSVPGDEAPPPVVLPVVTIPFGDIDTDFTSTDFVDSEKSIRFLRVYNGTDADLALSDDNSTDKWLVPAGATREFDFGSMGQVLVVSEDIFIKRTEAISSGNVYIEGSY